MLSDKILVNNIFLHPKWLSTAGRCHCCGNAPLAITHFCKRHIMCRIWAKANPSPIRDDIRILNGQQWKSLLVDIYGLFKMCGLNVEVIEDSIDAMGGSFCRGALTPSTVSSWAPPARAIAFCASDLGGGWQERRGAGCSGIIYQTQNPKIIRHMHKSKSWWCECAFLGASQYTSPLLHYQYQVIRLIGDAKLAWNWICCKKENETTNDNKKLRCGYLGPTTNYVQFGDEP